MAQMAAAETLASVVGDRTQNLFGAAGADVRAAIGGLGTVVQFGGFARQFFTRLTTRVLDYFLSRAFSYHVGPDKRFATLAEQARFDQALGVHCREAAAIVERFSGEWFSKERWEAGGEITRERAADFAHGAFQKLVSELKAGARHG
jgi:hypothetical protein